MRRRRERESGFALLLVFVMAAVLAIMLYLEMPRVAFESQREREEMLIARGSEYRRAIQLYFRRFRRYPPTLDALENTNNIRFLRRRYKDPMTGKEEWRIIHAGPGGVMIDSLTMKPAQKTDASGVPVADASSPSNNPQDVQRWQLLRPSEAGGGPGRVIGAGTPAGGDDPNAPAPEDLPPDTTGVVGVTGDTGATGATGATGPTGMLGIPPVVDPGVNPGVVVLRPGGGPAGATGSNPALDAIMRQITTPSVRPGLGGPQTIGGGIAGVATTLEAEGIKSYNKRSKYQEWEFIYDTRQDLAGGMPTLPGAGGAPVNAGTPVTP